MWRRNLALMGAYLRHERFRPARLVGGALVWLVVIAQLPLAGTFGPVTLRRLDLFAGWRPKRVSAAATAVSTAAPGATPVVPVRPRQGSVPKPSGDWSRPRQPIEMAVAGSLDTFNQALAGLGQATGPVRIAYFGDSLVEGDMITGDLRAEYQKTFGGSGVGYLPITSEVAQFRATVTQAFSDDWQATTLLDRKRTAPLGFGGQVWVPGCGASGCSGWVEYKVAKRSESINLIHVYVSHVPEGASVDYSPDGGFGGHISLATGDEVQEVTLALPAPAKSVRLIFNAPQPMHVYGAALDDNQGVTLDNFALRSHSGLSLSGIPSATLQAFDHLRHYDLVVLHYGTNVANAEQDNAAWYGRGIAGVIAHMKASLPGSSLLVVGVADRSHKVGEEFETIPSVPSIVERQRQAARNSGVAFWDLYTAMGGHNAMADWVAHDPPLAALDRTHFSHPGGRRIARFLFEALMAEYQTYARHASR